MNRLNASKDATYHHFILVIKVPQKEVVMAHQKKGNGNGYPPGSVMRDLSILLKRKAPIVETCSLGRSLQVGDVRRLEPQNCALSKILYGGGVGVCVCMYSPSIWLACCC